MAGLDIAEVLKEVNEEVESIEGDMKTLREYLKGSDLRITTVSRMFQADVSAVLGRASTSLFLLKSINWKLYNARIAATGSVSVQKSIQYLQEEIRELSSSLITVINALSEISRNLRSMTAY